MTAWNYNTGKMRPSLILRDMAASFEELVKVRENGALKYERNNWAESIGTDDAERFMDDSIDSMHRHILSIEKGEIKDKESKCYHLAHIAIRAMMVLEYQLAMKMDDMSEEMSDEELKAQWDALTQPIISK